MMTIEGTLARIQRFIREENKTNFSLSHSYIIQNKLSEKDSLLFSTYVTLVMP